jgi:hypothetical protein
MSRALANPHQSICSGPDKAASKVEGEWHRRQAGARRRSLRPEGQGTAAIRGGLRQCVGLKRTALCCIGTCTREKSVFSCSAFPQRDTYATACPGRGRPVSRSRDDWSQWPCRRVIVSIHPLCDELAYICAVRRPEWRAENLVRGSGDISLTGGGGCRSNTISCSSITTRDHRAMKSSVYPAPIGTSSLLEPAARAAVVAHSASFKIIFPYMIGSKNDVL